MAADHALLLARDDESPAGAGRRQRMSAASAAPVSVHDAGRRIEPYDFRHPEKLSKEQLRGLQILQQGVATSMAQALSTRLRAPVETRLASLDRTNYEEYTAGLGSAAIIVIIDMAPLQGYAVAAFGLDIAFAILDRLLGGRGKTTRVDAARDLTDIEVALTRHIAADIAGSLVEPWARVAEIRPEVTDLAVGPQVVHVVPPSEFVIAAHYELRFAGQTGALSLCFPLTILEQITPRLSGQTLVEHRPREAADTALNIRPDQVQPMQVGVRSVLGSTRISATELATVAPGDVLLLDARVDDPVKVLVGNIERFAASPGIRGNRMALQLTGIIDDDGVILPFEREHGVDE